MALKIGTSGPHDAKIMIVGDAPSVSDERAGRPFMGSSGELLTQMLHDAGITVSECFLTNVCKYRPFDSDVKNLFEDRLMRKPRAPVIEGIQELEKEIQNVRPNVIVALGNLPLWALRNLPSASKGAGTWRGSELPISPTLATRVHPHGHNAAVIPVYHPSAIFKQWAWRSITVHDLRKRVKKYINDPRIQIPSYNFLIRPSFPAALEYLNTIHRKLDEGSIRKLAVDIETRHGHIACVGIATDRFNAVCIPLLCVERQEGYWSAQEEQAIILKLRDVLEHKNAKVIGQNFLYDAQHFAKHYGIYPRVTDDTMFMQHVLFAGMQKGLDFLSSMYCEFHQYWKDEGKTWDAKLPEEQLWVYNCKDAVVTFEIEESLAPALTQVNLDRNYKFQMELWHHVFRMMLRGVNIDKAAKGKLAGELIEASLTREHAIAAIAGHTLNPRSPKQMKAFFYDDLNVPKQFSRKGKNDDGSRKTTLDEEALQAIAKKEPLLRDLIRNIVEYRSIGVFLSTFVQAALDSDGRMRCYFNPAGTETYRFSSSENAFGSGTNLQNIPRGLEDEAVIDASELMQYKTPNIRKLFRPDTNYTLFEIDLAGADAQVVAWEADDEILKQIFRENRKLHVENGKMMYGASMMGADGKREPYYTRVKMGVHMSNYGGSAKTLSMALNIPIHEAELFQRRWFGIHPDIKGWHRRTEASLQATRSVSNKFGYRRYYFDRVEGLLPEALAWVPQSTVAIIANTAITCTRPLVTDFSQQAFIADTLAPNIDALRLALQENGVEILLQVHDSLVGQYPTRNEASVLPLLQAATRVRIPYADSLIIPWGLKTSTISWGDAKERAWPK